MRALLLTLVLAAAGATPARAAEWTAPERLRLHVEGGTPAVGYDAGSRIALAGLDRRSGRLVQSAGGRTARGPRMRARVVAVLPPALIVSRHRERPRRHELAEYRVEGSQIRLAHRLNAAGTSASDVDVSASRDGWVAVAWSRTRGRTRRVQLALRSPAGRWSRARTLSPPGERARDTGVAVTGGGRGVAAWRGPRRIEAATFEGARTWGPRSTSRPPSPPPGRGWSPGRRTRASTTATTRRSPGACWPPR